MNVLRLFTGGVSREINSEQALVVEAQGGSRRAFDALARIYTPLLHRFLASRVSANSVDDVLQDTLLAAWTGIPAYTRRSRFKAWLFAIAVHKCTDHYRQKGRSANDVPLEQADFLPVAPDGRTDAYTDVEQRMDVRAALGLLPPEQREVLELYYFAELSLPETADALGRNLNTVKYQFYRAHTLAGRHLEAAEQPASNTQAAGKPGGNAGRPSASAPTRNPPAIKTSAVTTTIVHSTNRPSNNAPQDHPGKTIQQKGRRQANYDV